MASYYRKFIKNFAKIAAPLYKASTKGKKFEWTDECDGAFKSLQSALTGNEVLIFPNFNDVFRLETDASDEGLGAVLSQKREDAWRPIAYWSRHLASAERKYSTTEKEALAIVLAVEHFRMYLYGQEFVVVTDHQPLKWLMTIKEPQPRVARWIVRLSEYQFTIEYRPGSVNGNADALSRWPADRVWVKDEDENEEFEVNAIQLVNETNGDQELDEDICKIIEWMRESETRPDKTNAEGELRILWNQWDRLRVVNGQLFRVWRVNDKQVTYQYVVPKHKRMEILKMMHDTSWSGHFGYIKTLGRMEPKFYWPNMCKAVNEYVRSCEECARPKPPPGYSRAPLKPIITTKPFQLVTSDIMGPLTQTERGNKYVIVFIDHFTKWVELFPMQNMEAKTVAGCLLQVIYRHGVPEALLTDQGRNYEAEIFKEVLDLLHVHILRTTPYHPQCDGLSERFNRTLIGMLRIFVDVEKNNWDLLLEELVFAYRTTVHSVTGQMPFEMLYGRHPKLPIDIIINSGEEPREVEYEEYARELKQRLQEVYKLVTTTAQRRIEKTKLLYDRNVRPAEYQAGDKVWVLCAEQRKGMSRKLLKMWKGPYEVVEKLNERNYRLQTIRQKRRKRLTVHLNRLKRCYASEPETVQAHSESQGSTTGYTQPETTGAQGLTQTADESQTHLSQTEKESQESGQEAAETIPIAERTKRKWIRRKPETLRRQPTRACKTKTSGQAS